ncbi:hypothetical protein Scep_022538 [Stephania cephalantha]|uniref:Uncharacterized protein n=1 Tax=Stephania cephalantha TaxID=152367 RepID=A0AAP0F6D2_9MAGN
MSSARLTAAIHPPHSPFHRHLRTHRLSRSASTIAIVVAFHRVNRCCVHSCLHRRLAPHRPTGPAFAAASYQSSLDHRESHHHASFPVGFDHRLPPTRRRLLSIVATSYGANCCCIHSPLSPLLRPPPPPTSPASTTSTITVAVWGRPTPVVVAVAVWGRPTPVVVASDHHLSSSPPTARTTAAPTAASTDASNSTAALHYILPPVPPPPPPQ